MRRRMRRHLGLGLYGGLLPGLALAQTASPPGSVTALPEVNVIAASPLLGTGIDRNLVPAQTQVFTARTSPARAARAPCGRSMTRRPG